MNTTLLRIPAYWADYYAGRIRTQPINLTVSVTFNCNSRCATCGIWRKNLKDELSLSEFNRTFEHMDDVYWLTLSGGEPMLRRDLADVAESAYERIHPKIINIPTNALVAKTPYIVEDIVSRCRNSTIVVNVSIDGAGEEDDRIRGVPGAYLSAVNTVKRLQEIEAKNLVVGVHTVISKKNVDSIHDTYDAVMKLSPDSYVTEVAEERVELDNIGSRIAPQAGEYAIAVDFLLHEMEKDKAKGLSKITQSFRKQYYQIAEQVLRQKRQIIPCYAGIASAHISPAGDVWACCVRAETLGNLRDSDYDFRKIWGSWKAKQIRRSIKNRQCACPLANAHYTSMLMHPPTLAKVIPGILI